MLVAGMMVLAALFVNHAARRLRVGGMSVLVGDELRKQPGRGGLPAFCSAIVSQFARARSRA